MRRACFRHLLAIPHLLMENNWHMSGNPVFFTSVGETRGDVAFGSAPSAATLSTLSAIPHTALNAGDPPKTSSGFLP